MAAQKLPNENIFLKEKTASYSLLIILRGIKTEYKYS
jgi:hypothetical protein